MSIRGIRRKARRAAVMMVVGGSLFQVGSCDPTVRTTLLTGLQVTTEALFDTLVATFFTSLANDNDIGGGGGGLTTT